MSVAFIFSVVYKLNLGNIFDWEFLNEYVINITNMFIGIFKLLFIMCIQIKSYCLFNFIELSFERFKKIINTIFLVKISCSVFLLRLDSGD